MKVSILIPAYNEESTIRELLTRVKQVRLPANVEKEVIVVDDASTDDTFDVLSKIKGVHVYRHPKNKGKGAAIRTALSKSTGEVLIIQDADLEYNPKDYPRLLQPILNKDVDVVYGTRLKDFPLRMRGAKRTPLILHYIGNRFLSFMTNLIYDSQITDMETCYKVFTSRSIAKVTFRSNRFDFEPEFTAKILKQGYTIHEIPIKVIPRGYTEGKKISWVDGFVALWTLLKYRFID
jgi:glycosyltransferase involved in cell wall biosynthesis